ncbi:NUDIX hydrolase [Candidatus Dependentiae bacterium]|nr:MAG: NUDIX hydrolase [Candidatus Dependentiae bacterium]
MNEFEYSSEDEVLDLVDSQDRVVGSMKRSDIFRQRKNNYRAVIALIINEQGKLLITRRAADKPILPGALHCVGGCVKSGETYEQAIIREIYEEVALDLKVQPYHYLGQLTPEHDKSAGYVAVYKIPVVDTVQLHYHQSDFSAIFWLSVDQLTDKIVNGEKVATNLPILMRRFFCARSSEG